MGITNKLILATLLMNTLVFTQSTVITSNDSTSKILETIRRTEEAKLQILKYETEQYYKRLREEYWRRDGVGLNPKDITKVTGITSEEMSYVLQDTSMSPLAPYFVEAENTYGVNAFALAGIVALESSWNTSRRANDDNNLTGYAVYSDSSKGANFDSKRECILATAKLLSTHYLVPEGDWYNGTSIYSVNENYSADERWSSKIVAISEDFEDIYRTEYLSDEYLSELDEILPNK